MATVAAVIASTHHPFYYRASTSAGPDRPPFADEWVAKIGAFRQTLSRARPDVLVMVGSDHFHQLWLDNMPAEQRVAIIGTGHLSLELGCLRQFGPHGPDPGGNATQGSWTSCS